ncbi:MAG: DNA-3-methyladenine glycosylase I [Rothia mucilaginosa]|uniref:DNA-3-methyladenine glycosylase I n=1 Tax=Rothia mucilaginosa TaxID=43675 RepID=A0A930L3I2_9MICC|nr:DNA-3-methyladenine glycosylase I [Rothia mucilaginosa]MBF1658239.1 DNA-3-methyladenine glycosylase I [Rothia mucilaginosa]
MTLQPTIPATTFENTPSYPMWVTDELLRDYYDTEWGMPVTDERGIFEALSLEAFQVGLSWRTILARREAFRRAFEGFDPERVAAFTNQDVARLLQDEEIIRNERKIRAVISNARLALRMRELAATPRDAYAEDIHLSLIAPSSTLTNTDSVEAPNARRRRVRTLSDEDLDRMRERTLSDGTRVPGGLPAWLWSFAPHETIAPHTLEDIPTDTPESALLAKSFKALGGVFLGPVTAYALMCAVGMVDAHLVDSHRRGCSGLFT